MFVNQRTNERTSKTAAEGRAAEMMRVQEHALMLVARRLVLRFARRLFEHVDRHDDNDEEMMMMMSE